MNTMSATTINIQLDQQAARIYRDASDQKRDKYSLLIGMWLRELEYFSLPSIMDRISDNAQKRGLTPEILNSLLHDERTTLYLRYQCCH